ncbi:DUF2191 domain-containing protein [Actinoplanes sp. DH11]|uniref:DUF2191 domain-containing protein n=1 Tax=Actinoplanes sp. DH11 TaxID=2857011 RepID=UPI001E5968A0|nr:DUF2191 domain-containing protein [Actinoplanes sp. DH11]
MIKRAIEVDQAALAVAAGLLGTAGEEETVNAALREIAALRRRLLSFDEKAAEAGGSAAAQRT